MSCAEEFIMDTHLPLAIKMSERIEIQTLIDNYVDLLLPPSETVSRPPLAIDGRILDDTLLAEHGLSLLVTTHMNGQKHSILFDTGYTHVGVPHNMARLGVDIAVLEAIVISHGHMDHTGALGWILDQRSAPIPLVVHPGAFAHPRYTRTPDGSKRLFPRTLVPEVLAEKNAAIVESQNPVPIADDSILVTGEVERNTPFEKGFPNALIEKDGQLVQDPIVDDQAIVMNLKNKGLVVISGCAHAGIINTLHYACKISGEKRVYAVLGGFHLSGPFYQKALQPTVREMQQIDPALVVPMHCTGWKAVTAFQEAFPESFLLNSVGSKVTLTSATDC